VVESGANAVASSIPATLEDSLMARLDRLGAAKAIVQVGAVVGREFSYALIHAVLPIAEAELQSGLAKATDAELLYSRGLPPEAGYVFKHALVQDAAYQALLKSERRRLHRDIAQVLRDRFPALVADHPEILAHHHAQAGEAEAAAAALQSAGEMSVARGAFKEAEDHYARARDLLDQTPRTPELDETMLRLQLALGQVLLASRGYASQEVQAAYARAGELGARVGDPAQMAFTLVGVWLSNLLRSELRAAQAVADQLLTAATERHAGLRVWGHLASGMTRFHRGDLLGARTHLDQAVSLYGEGFTGAATLDPAVAALGYASRTAWHLGLTDTARARIEGALDLARRLQNPLDLAGACSYAAGVYLLLGDIERAGQHAAMLSALATEHHLPFYAADALVLQGRVLAARESGTTAIEMMRAGIHQQIANGQRVGLGYYLGLVADACIRAGALEEARAAVEEALRAVPEERVDHPRLLHLQGEVHLAMAAAGGEGASHLEAAERRLREALVVAHEIGSTMSELGAAITLGRVLHASGRPDEARALLAPLYARFTEGFDRAPLTEAKALLDALDR
jgi:tetratricopeptide (TPR) repeat protein